MQSRTSVSAASRSAGALTLEVAAGFGFRAEVTEEGLLQLQQANQDGEFNDTVVLTRAEARQLFREFAAWIG